MSAVWADEGTAGTKGPLVVCGLGAESIPVGPCVDRSSSQAREEEQRCRRTPSERHTNGDCYARVRDVFVGLRDPVKEVLCRRLLRLIAVLILESV